MTSSQQLFSPALGELEPGGLSMRAPVINDAVQLNISRRDMKEFCSLGLDIDPDSVSVKREDGKKLQIEKHPPRIIGASALVLVEPVDEIIFRRVDRSYWLIEPVDLEIKDVNGLVVFANTLAGYGSLKQQSN